MSLLEQYTGRGVMPLPRPKVYHADGCYKELATGDCWCGVWKAADARLVPAPWARPVLALVDRIIADAPVHNQFRVGGRGKVCAQCNGYIRPGQVAGYNDDEIVCATCWACERDHCNEC